MKSPIFGFAVNSRWDQLGEVPIVSTFTSVARFAKGILCGLWDVASLDTHALKQDARDVGLAICEVFPFVNMVAAYYFGYCAEWNAKYHECTETTEKASSEELKRNIQLIQNTSSFLTRSRADRIALSVYQSILHSPPANPLEQQPPHSSIMKDSHIHTPSPITMAPVHVEAITQPHSLPTSKPSTPVNINPLIRAVCLDQMDVVQKLIGNYTPENLNTIDHTTGKTALMEAIFMGHEGIASLLMEKMTPEGLALKGALPRETALLYAIEAVAQNEIGVDFTKKLINKIPQKDLGAVDIIGDTPLMVAIDKNQKDIALHLISKMAPKDLRIANTFGRTAKRLAKEKGWEDVVSAIQESQTKV